jgi:hypothetical protein
MKSLISISYWAVAICIVALIMVSLGYTYSEAVFFGTLYIPGAIAVKYFFRKVSFKNKTSGIKNIIFITIGIIVVEILLFLIAHFILSVIREDIGSIYNWPALPGIMLNPVFIAIIIAALSISNWFLEQWLNKKFVSEQKQISFLSERKKITISLSEILYIESNDSITTVIASNGNKYRNKTMISQWEDLLGNEFIRIHRSYLVNKASITETDADLLFIENIELPISRKYKKTIQELEPRYKPNH